MEPLHIGEESIPVTEFETFNTEESFCPVCFSSDRARLFALFIHDVIKGRLEFPKNLGPRGGLVLHFAPDNGFAGLLRKVTRREAMRYMTADLFGEGVDEVIDITSMKQLESGSVDVLIASHVLEHVLEEELALSEIHRVLNAQGWGILMVPILNSIAHVYEPAGVSDPVQRKRIFGQEDHVRVYGRDGFRSRLRNAGFIVHEFSVADWSSRMFRRLGIAQTSRLYVVSKS